MSEFVEQKETEPPVLEAQEFRLVDHQRRVRGKFGIDPDGCPQIILFESNGANPAVSLHVDESDVPRVRLHHSGEVTLTLTQDGAGNPRLWIYGADSSDNTPRVALLLDKDGVASLELFAQGSNEAGISLHVQPSGEAQVGIWDEALDKPMIGFAVRENSGGEISLRNPEGTIVWTVRSEVP